MACSGPWVQSLQRKKRKGRKENGKKEKEGRNKGRGGAGPDEPVHGGQVSWCLSCWSLSPCAKQVDPMVCTKEFSTVRPLLWFRLGQWAALPTGGWDGRRAGGFPSPCSGSLCDFTCACQPLLHETTASGIYAPTSSCCLLKDRMGPSSFSRKVPCPLTSQAPTPLRVSPSFKSSHWNHLGCILSLRSPDQYNLQKPFSKRWLHHAASLLSE